MNLRDFGKKFAWDLPCYRRIDTITTIKPQITQKLPHNGNDTKPTNIFKIFALYITKYIWYFLKMI